MNVWGMGWQSAVVETGHLFASQNASRVRHLHMTTTSAAVSTVLVASPWGAGRSFGRRLGFGRHLRARPQQAVDAPLVGGSGSLMKRTRRWREPDSNHRSRPRVLRDGGKTRANCARSRGSSQAAIAAPTRTCHPIELPVVCSGAALMATSVGGLNEAVRTSGPTVIFELAGQPERRPSRSARRIACPFSRGERFESASKAITTSPLSSTTVW